MHRRWYITDGEINHLTVENDPKKECSLQKVNNLIGGKVFTKYQDEPNNAYITEFLKLSVAT